MKTIGTLNLNRKISDALNPKDSLWTTKAEKPKSFLQTTKKKRGFNNLKRKHTLLEDTCC